MNIKLVSPSKAYLVRELHKYPVRLKYGFHHTKGELIEIITALENGGKDNILETVAELQKNYNITFCTSETPSSESPQTFC